MRCLRLVYLLTTAITLSAAIVFTNHVIPMSIVVCYEITVSLCPVCQTRYSDFISEDVALVAMCNGQDYKKYIMEIVMSDADVRISVLTNKQQYEATFKKYKVIIAPVAHVIACNEQVMKEALITIRDLRKKPIVYCNLLVLPYRTFWTNW